MLPQGRATQTVDVFGILLQWMIFFGVEKLIEKGVYPLIRKHAFPVFYSLSGWKVALFIRDRRGDFRSAIAHCGADTQMIPISNGDLFMHLAPDARGVLTYSMTLDASETKVSRHMKVGSTSIPLIGKRLVIAYHKTTTLLESDKVDEGSKVLS